MSAGSASRPPPGRGVNQPNAACAVGDVSAGNGTRSLAGSVTGGLACKVDLEDVVEHALLEVERGFRDVQQLPALLVRRRGLPDELADLGEVTDVDLLVGDEEGHLIVGGVEVLLATLNQVVQVRVRVLGPVAVPEPRDRAFLERGVE